MRRTHNGRSKVLFFAYYYPPQKTSGAERPRRFTKYLPDFGYEAIVLSATDAPGIRIVSNSPEDSFPATSPSLLTRFAASAADIMQRVLDERSERLPWAARAVATARSIVQQTSVTAIFSTSPPLSTHLAAMCLKSAYGIPWVADFRDPFADNPIRRSRLQAWYDPILERRIFRDADAIIANTDAVSDLWARRYPEHRQKIHLIWNGFDPAESFRPQPIAHRTRHVLAHVGDIYGPRHPGRVLASAERLVAEGRIDPVRLRIDLVGPVDPTSPLWTMPAFHSLSARGILHANNQVIPREEAMQIIGAADYLLLLDFNSVNGNLQVPAKIFDYIRAGRPLLAETRANSAVDRILAQSGAYYVRIEPEDTFQVLDRKIGDFLNSQSRYYEPGPWFWSQFDGREQTRRLAAILDGIGVCS